MTHEYTVSKYSLAQYLLQKERLQEIDARLNELSIELSELAIWTGQITQIFSDEPKAVGKTDKTANGAIKIMEQHRNYTTQMQILEAEKTIIGYELGQTRLAIAKVADEQLRMILTWQYVEGITVQEMVKREYVGDDGKVLTLGMTPSGINKRIQRYFKTFDATKSRIRGFVPSYST